MAARLRKTHQDDVRAKIQAANLITLLQKNAEGTLKDKNGNAYELSPGRITSAKILLDKSVSNAPTELTGANGGPLQVQDVPWLRDRRL
jgi:hypothetical protein